MVPHDGAHAAHPGQDEQRVGDGADRDDHADVAACEPLTQDEGVLRADGDDERQAGEEPGEG